MTTLTIWIDADACPNPIKDILYRVANRLQVPLILVANHALQTPPSPHINAVQVPGGFDVADQHIVEQVNPGDVVITADIPLAADILQKNAYVLTPRGEQYTSNTIGQRLQLRNFMEEMRASGERTGGPAPLHQRDRQQFANALDRLLAKLIRQHQQG